jgi:hypothetical protein
MVAVLGTLGTRPPRNSNQQKKYVIFNDRVQLKPQARRYFLLLQLLVTTSNSTGSTWIDFQYFS